MGWRKDEPHWYLRGWETRQEVTQSGRTKNTLVYTGEYYSFRMTAQAQNRMKAAYAVLTAALTACYVVSALGTHTGARTIWGGAVILTIIPLMYLLIGMCCMLRVPEKLTYRDRFASWCRLRYSSIFSTVLLAVGFLGQLVYVIAVQVPSSDIVWLGEIAFCLICSSAILILTQKYPARLIPPPLQ